MLVISNARDLSISVLYVSTSANCEYLESFLELVRKNTSRRSIIVGDIIPGIKSSLKDLTGNATDIREGLRRIAGKSTLLTVYCSRAVKFKQFRSFHLSRSGIFFTPIILRRKLSEYKQPKANTC